MILIIKEDAHVRTFELHDISVSRDDCREQKVEMVARGNVTHFSQARAARDRGQAVVWSPAAWNVRRSGKYGEQNCTMNEMGEQSRLLINLKCAHKNQPCAEAVDSGWKSKHCQSEHYELILLEAQTLPLLPARVKMCQHC